MDGRISRRAHTGSHIKGRKLLPASGFDLVFSPGIPQRSTRQASFDGAQLRSLRDSRISLRERSIERCRNYCGLIKIARSGFPWEKTTKVTWLPRISSTRHLRGQRGAAFFTESRMQFDGTNKLQRKSGFGLHQLRNRYAGRRYPKACYPVRVNSSLRPMVCIAIAGFFASSVRTPTSSISLTTNSGRCLISV
jgi:hypothetical protein